MNESILEYLVSPVSRNPLELLGPGYSQSTDNDQKNQERLLDRYADEEFPIVDGVPLLQPKMHVADYSNNVLDVIFQGDHCQLRQELVEMANKSPQEYERSVRERVSMLGKNRIRSSFRTYSELTRDRRLASFLCSGGPTDLAPSEEDIQRGREYATAAFGKRRAEQMKSMIAKWAAHVPQYATEVVDAAPTVILELGCGSGLGTSALLEKGLGDARLLSVDIDFACCRIADGLARWYEVKDRVDPIVASFWFLPLKDSSTDVVCAHYGVDEAREVTRILEEVARVLVGNGLFVNVSRADPTLRLSQWLEPLGFADGELKELATMSDLYSGPDMLIETAGRCGLILRGLHRLSQPTSHERVLFAFKKVS